MWVTYQILTGAKIFGMTVVNRHETCAFSVRFAAFETIEQKRILWRVIAYFQNQWIDSDTVIYLRSKLVHAACWRCLGHKRTEKSYWITANAESRTERFRHNCYSMHTFLDLLFFFLAPTVSSAGCWDKYLLRTVSTNFLHVIMKTQNQICVMNIKTSTNSEFLNLVKKSLQGRFIRNTEVS